MRADTSNSSTFSNCQLQWGMHVSYGCKWWCDTCRVHPSHHEKCIRGGGCKGVKTAAARTMYLYEQQQVRYYAWCVWRQWYSQVHMQYVVGIIKGASWSKSYVCRLGLGCTVMSLQWSAWYCWMHYSFWTRWCMYQPAPHDLVLLLISVQEHEVARLATEASSTCCYVGIPCMTYAVRCSKKCLQ